MSREDHTASNSDSRKRAEEAHRATEEVRPEDALWKRMNDAVLPYLRCESGNHHGDSCPAVIAAMEVVTGALDEAIRQMEAHPVRWQNGGGASTGHLVAVDITKRLRRRVWDGER